jgi:hypothetical protein
MPALRSIALSLLLVNSAAAIAQNQGFANNPYTATKKITFVQKLVDGTTITRVSTNTEARDSQGRTLVQQGPPVGSLGQSFINTTVIDPVAHTTTIWMSQAKQATRIHMPEIQRPTPNPTVTTSSVGSGVIGGIAVTSTSIEATVMGSAGPVAVGLGSGPGPIATDPNLRPARQSEKLGGKTIAGIYVEGTKITITYPIGFFGNDRPIVNVRETWTSPDLKLIVLSTDEDPRNGSRTTELTDLIRGEPDPALFQVPEGYTVKDQYPGQN